MDINKHNSPILIYYIKYNNQWRDRLFNTSIDPVPYHTKEIAEIIIKTTMGLSMFYNLGGKIIKKIFTI